MMDSKDLELYYEEQRQLLLDIQGSLQGLNKLIQKQIDTYEPPKENLTVKGEVQVNTEKEVEVKNLEVINETLNKIAEQITTSIKDNKPVSEVIVKNLKDAITKEVEVRNLKKLEKGITDVKDAIDKKDMTVNVEKQELKLPNSAKDYISVRLTDGKKFYNAITQFATAVDRLPLVISEETGQLVLAIANADGSMIQGGTVTADTTDTLLLESGDNLLLETGDELLLET